MLQEKQKKYRINEMLGKLPHAFYKKAMNALPALLEISSRTFDNYRAINIDDKKDIPYRHVVAMEQFFGVEAGALSNLHFDIKSINKKSDALAEKFGLTKP